jgi:hypothetical protein
VGGDAGKIRHLRAGEGPEGGEEGWMLAFASMTVEASPPFHSSPIEGEDFLFFVTRRLSAESISPSGMDSPVLPTNDEKKSNHRTVA